MPARRPPPEGSGQDGGAAGNGFDAHLARRASAGGAAASGADAVRRGAAVITLALALVCAFLAVLFLQSGLDKVFDREGNVEWLTGHFAKSPLAEFVGPMVTVITVFEVAAGVFSALGAVAVLLLGSRLLAACGVVLSALSLLQLFFGQRIAKDYAGAAVLVPYFVLTILALFLLSLPA